MVIIFYKGIKCEKRFKIKNKFKRKKISKKINTCRLLFKKLILLTLNIHYPKLKLMFISKRLLSTMR